MSKISVVIPCHNEEDRIERCLRHIVSQKGFDELVEEVLVINDGSLDRSPEIIAAFSKEYLQVRLITNPANIGLAKSVNRGFSSAKGEFVLIMHADCILEDEGYLATMFRIVSSSPQIAVVTSKYVVKNQGKSSFKNRLFLLLNFVAVGLTDEVKGQCERNGTIEIGFTEFKCDIVRKDVFLSLGGFTERLFACGEDQYLCVDMRESGYQMLMALSKAYTMDFGSHQDKIPKVILKQVTYGEAIIHVFWKKRGRLLRHISFWNKNRMVRSINRMFQLAFPPLFVLLGFLLYFLDVLFGLLWVGLGYMGFRILFYILPNRKYLFSVSDVTQLAFWGIVADVLYFYGILKGTVLTFLNRTIK